MKVKGPPSVDELIAIEEEKARAQKEKLLKLKALKQTEDKKNEKIESVERCQ